MTIVAVVIILFGLLSLLALVVSLIKPGSMVDPKTGKAPGNSERGGMAAIAGIALTVGFLLFPSKKTEAPGETLAVGGQQVTQIKPETIITFPQGNIACLTEEALQSALIAGIEGKKTKMLSHFEGDAECIMLDSHTRFKVIDAHYRNADAPEAAILEVVGENIQAAERGAYTMILDKSFVNVVFEP